MAYDFAEYMATIAWGRHRLDEPILDHLQRNHQGLDNRLIEYRAPPANSNGRVVRRTRLGGLRSFYPRAA